MTFRSMLGTVCMTMMLLSAGPVLAAGCSVMNSGAFADEALKNINAQRKANGLAPVKLSSALGKAAAAHACDMSKRNFFSHVDPNGGTIVNRVEKAGYNYCFVAENIAWGQKSIGVVMDAWMHSKGHRKNMLTKKAKEFGVAAAQSPKGLQWVLVMGRSC